MRGSSPRSSLALVALTLCLLRCARGAAPDGSVMDARAARAEAVAVTDSGVDARVSAPPLRDEPADEAVPREGPWIVDVALRFEDREGGALDPRVYNLLERRWIDVRREGSSVRVRAAFGDALLVLDGERSARTFVRAERGALFAPVRLARPWTFRGTVREWVQQSDSHAGAPIEGALISVEGGFEGAESLPPGVFARPRRAPPPFASGWLRYCGGRVAPQAMVASAAPVRSDREGRFALPLRARIYPVTVCAPGYAPQSFSWMHRAQIADSPEPLELLLQRSAPIRGRVLDERGQPLAGVRVETDVHMGMPDGILTPLDATITAADGSFSLEAPAGDRRIVRVVIEGRRPAQAEDVLAGTSDLVLRAPSFSLSAALGPVAGAVFHREGAAAQDGAVVNLVLEANGTFRAESAGCGSAAVLEGRFTPLGAGASLSVARGTRWRIRAVGDSDERELGPDSWLDGGPRASLRVSLARDGAMVLTARVGGRAVRERFVRGASCAACSETGLMAGRLLRAEACEGHAVQRYGNGFPEVAAR